MAFSCWRLSVGPGEHVGSNFASRAFKLTKILHIFVWHLESKLLKCNLIFGISTEFLFIFRVSGYSILAFLWGVTFWVAAHLFEECLDVWNNLLYICIMLHVVYNGVSSLILLLAFAISFAVDKLLIIWQMTFVMYYYYIFHLVNLALICLLWLHDGHLTMSY